ncbi:glycosyl hydrolase family 9 [Escherichia phage IMM-001]|nr:glycosyl hydrolase family 9 [Escherichia phage IMM-001]
MTLVRIKRHIYRKSHQKTVHSGYGKVTSSNVVALETEKCINDKIY